MRLFVVFGFIALGQLACNSSYPDELVGRRITGTVHYGGDQHLKLERPAIGVYAFATWPPGGPPHASWVQEIDKENPQIIFEYELIYLPPFQYRILATIKDLEDPEGVFLAAGGYPNYCKFGTTPVAVVEDEPTGDVDIELYDSGGQDDPCKDEVIVIDPDPGKASIAADFIGPDLGYEVQTGDQLILALFSVWPAQGPPALVQNLKGLNAILPVQIISNSVPPGSYAIFGCLDVNSDSVACDQPGDFGALVDNGSMIDFAEGAIIEVEMNVKTGIGQIK